MAVGKIEEEGSVAAVAAESSRMNAINLDHGDPTIFEAYWQKVGEMGSITFTAGQSLSYFANPKGSCWFLEPKLEQEIKNLHAVVKNAKVDDHFIIVGNGSSQLIQAALFALSPPHQPQPTSVVAAAPFYSTYQEEADLLSSRLYRWGGDAHKFEEDGPYIEMVTSPNNPDGETREPKVNRPGGCCIYDLAYYWPQYTAITAELDHDIMLFTASKCTGHAGSRIGWALVREEEVARKMVKFMEVSSIGVSKESQLRAAKILSIISESCRCEEDDAEKPKLENFFLHSQRILADRWKRLRAVVEEHRLFSLPKYPRNFCLFTKDFVEANPAFAWMCCNSGGDLRPDCAKMLKDENILARSGRRFGWDPKYVRISMVGRDEEFNVLLQKLSAMQETTAPAADSNHHVS